MIADTPPPNPGEYRYYTCATYFLFAKNCAQNSDCAQPMCVLSMQLENLVIVDRQSQIWVAGVKGKPITTGTQTVQIVLLHLKCTYKS